MQTSYDYYKANANLDLLLAKIKVKMLCTTSLKFYSCIKTFIAYINYKSEAYEYRFSLFEATQMTELDIGILSEQICRELQDGI